MPRGAKAQPPEARPSPREGRNGEVMAGSRLLQYRALCGELMRVGERRCDVVDSYIHPRRVLGVSLGERMRVWRHNPYSARVRWAHRVRRLPAEAAALPGEVKTVKRRCGPAKPPKTVK